MKKNTGILAAGFTFTSLMMACGSNKNEKKEADFQLTTKEVKMLADTKKSMEFKTDSIATTAKIIWLKSDQEKADKNIYDSYDDYNATKVDLFAAEEEAKLVNKRTGIKASFSKNSVYCASGDHYQGCDPSIVFYQNIRGHLVAFDEKKLFPKFEKLATK